MTKFETRLSIAVPSEIYQWKASEADRGKAKETQSRNREMFLEAFAAGSTVLAYERDGQGNGKFLLGEWDETWSYASQE